MNTEGCTPTLHCQICGISFVPNRCFSFGGRVCDRDCQQEYEWVKTLMIMGKKYYPDPKRTGDEKGQTDG